MTLLETNLGAGTIPKRRGKVRDVYDLGDRLLLVATDRISAFDWVLPDGIPDKGRVLTGLSVYWFDLLKIPNHLISTEVDAAGLDLTPADREALRGRSMVVRKARVVPFECVVRGYLSGSAWKEYRKSGSVCGISLDPGLVESQAIEPIFTPATKAETGHDENVSFELMARAVGTEIAETLQSMSLEVYRIAAEHAGLRDLILADTKFEWGFDDETGELLLVDEALHSGQLEVLVKGVVSAWGPAAVFRQTVRSRLARNDGLGQGEPSTCVARGRRAEDSREVHRSLRYA